ncbi:MAG: hypothetical protein EPO21_08090 [Chloroflexota bacterium]|nr:MAG: hypothetical protein EPO21_08090 [Chloroflexota bacterium]
METASVPAQLDEPLVAEVRCQHGNIICVMHAGPTGTWIRHPSLATCHIHPGARHVDVYPEPSGNERTLGLMLAGQISILVLRELGYPCLHASAVVTGQGAVAFLGTHGQGKSTMAASFLRRGAALLTDDALPLLMREDGVYGGPALPAMKLWNETAVHTLDLAEELPQLMPNVDKKLFALDGRYAFAPEPARLRAIYVLDRYDPLSCGHDDIRIEELSQRESLTTLLAQTSWSSLVQPAQSAALFMFYARLVSRVPVRVLSFPNGHHSQDAVCARVLADLEV